MNYCIEIHVGEPWSNYWQKLVLIAKSFKSIGVSPVGMGIVISIIFEQISFCPPGEKFWQMGRHAFTTLSIKSGFYDYLCKPECCRHYNDVIMCAMASQITSLMIVYSIVYSGRDQRKHQSSAFTRLCEGNSPVTGEFPAHRPSFAENVSIWWRHHDVRMSLLLSSHFSLRACR